MRELGCAFASAPGCNANSVAEYVVAALLDFDDNLEGKILGIIGYGHTGSRTAIKAKALGMHVMLNDPPKAAISALHQRDDPGPGIGNQYSSLKEVLKRSDFVSLHVPLNMKGKYPTFHLINSENISQIKHGAILINTSRGDVIDPDAVTGALKLKQLGGAVIDVWGEGEIHPDLFSIADIVTPHIAGHSFLGKLNGTKMIYEAACQYFHKKPSWDSSTCIEAKDIHTNTIRDAVKQSYDIQRDHRAFREEGSRAFHALRNNYPIRYEFSQKNVKSQILNKKTYSILHALGFSIDDKICD